MKCSILEPLFFSIPRWLMLWNIEQLYAIALDMHTACFNSTHLSVLFSNLSFLKLLQVCWISVTCFYLPERCTTYMMYPFQIHIKYCYLKGASQVLFINLIFKLILFMVLVWAVVFNWTGCWKYWGHAVGLFHVHHSLTV